MKGQKTRDTDRSERSRLRTCRRRNRRRRRRGSDGSSGRPIEADSGPPGSSDPPFHSYYSPAPNFAKFRSRLQLVFLDSNSSKSQKFLCFCLLLDSKFVVTFSRIFLSGYRNFLVFSVVLFFLENVVWVGSALGYEQGLTRPGSRLALLIALKAQCCTFIFFLRINVASY